MKHRGLKAKWFVEFYYPDYIGWQVLPVYFDGVWENAVTRCAKYTRNTTYCGKKVTKVRISSSAYQGLDAHPSRLSDDLKD